MKGIFGFMRGIILVMTVCESIWRISTDVVWPFLSLYILYLSGCYETDMTNVFVNPAFQSIFADMAPREKRGRIMASLGAGGIWLMGGAWGNGMLGMLTVTAGTFLSGYIYNYDSSLPWYILSGVLALMGILFITLVREPERAEL